MATASASRDRAAAPAGIVASDRRDVAALAAVVVAAIGVPLLLSTVTGSLGIPHNDAWSHARIAQTFATSGRIELVGWNRTSLLGQVVVLGPLGASVTAQNLFSALCGLVGLIAVWLLVRRRTSPGFALLVVATIAATPEFGLLATSYMSDIPAFAGMMLSLALLDQADERRSLRWGAASLGVALWAFTVREQALLVLVLAGWRLVRRRTSSGRPLGLLVCVIAVVAAVAFECWRRSLPNGDPPAAAFMPMSVVYTTFLTCFTAVLYLLPVVLRSAFRPWSIRAAAAALSISAASALVAQRLDWRVFLGNYFAPAGAYGGVAPLDRQVFPEWVYFTAAAVAVVALGPAAVCLANGARRAEPKLVAFLGLFALGTAAQSLVGQTIFARYLLPALPVLAIVFFPTKRQSRSIQVTPALGRSIAVAAVCCLVALSLALTANALSYDGARWHLAMKLVDRGLPTNGIDAGMDWVGFNSAEVADPRRLSQQGEPPYVAMMKAEICATVTGVPRRETQPVLRFTYRKYAVVGRAELVAYLASTCPPSA